MTSAATIRSGRTLSSRIPSAPVFPMPRPIALAASAGIQTARPPGAPAVQMPATTRTSDPASINPGRNRPAAAAAAQVLLAGPALKRPERHPDPDRARAEAHQRARGEVDAEAAAENEAGRAETRHDESGCEDLARRAPAGGQAGERKAGDHRRG